MIDENVLAVIAEIQSKKRVGNVFPEHVTLLELMTEVKASLNRLHTANKIIAGDTINDKYISIK